ncbi:MAG TPA: hypothetical protein VGX93_05875, partial [Chthoniobacterales bacterium]|nr:hypothetical protein [Chthoniobacterales bacterium]
EELHEDPAGLSLASRSGPQSRAAVFIAYWLCAGWPLSGEPKAKQVRSNACCVAYRRSGSVL